MKTKKKKKESRCGKYSWLTCWVTRVSFLAAFNRSRGGTNGGLAASLARVSATKKIEWNMQDKIEKDI